MLVFTHSRLIYAFDRPYMYIIGIGSCGRIIGIFNNKNNDEIDKNCTIIILLIFILCDDSCF